MTQCHHRDEAEAGGRATLTLEAEPLFVVGVLRAWVAALQPDPGAPEWRQIVALAGLPAAAATAFGSFMTLVRQSLRRSLDVRCCPCPRLGRDEEALLRLLGAMQCGDRLAALDELDAWLQPGNLTPALRSAEALAAMLARHDVRLARPGMPQPAPAADAAAGRVLQ
ncbi:hypothetical protein ACFQY5_07865 [Paeniroseomonas aquatica]|uniref:Uncharacterized protein n=1 Tax=Paeniroseomonas aquatica TaxID=373043 RepID=A0ABT8ABN3_9PROT|nr:hypothetical protein [Paeniroseomonas aquatica]MDN3567095.1 hypothetical protein [Paeniroseomonas aquatica]